MLFHLVVGFMCIILSTRAQNTSTPSPNSVEDDTDNYYPYPEWSDTFDWQLLKAVSALPYRNVLISPISLKLVLALLYEGSGGTTEKEFQRVMQFPVQKQLVRENFNNILNALQPSERKDFVLNLGTRIFLDSEREPQQNFAAKALHSYLTEIEKTNFSQPFEASVSINSWVDKLTNGRIQKLVNPTDLQDAIMLLCNAIYFKGTWRHQFPKNATKLGGFYISPTELVNVPYMRTTDNFFFFDSSDLDAKILRLPYRGKRYALFIVLPNSKGGLPDLIKKINLQTLKRQLYLMDEMTVDVSIPKFKFNFQTPYSKILKDFGLEQMFQNTASFPGIVRGNSTTGVLRMLVVSDIFQKTGIELNEEGSVVFAATEVTVGNRLGEPESTFNATHPFLFFIEEQTKGTILFVGKMENPLESDTVAIPDIPSRFSETASSAPAQANQVQPLNIPSLSPSNPEHDAIIRRFNYFDLELLQEFSENNGNVFISPASIKTTLALILEGAKGKSAEELGNALRIDDINRKEIKDILRRLLFDLSEKGQNTVLDSANAVFVSNKHKIIPAYQKTLNDQYKAIIQNVDFANSKDTSKLINSWVSNSTRGIIKEVIDAQSLSADTKIVLANALYFKGKWKTAFDSKSTKLRCFNSPTRGCVSTPMMVVADTFNYAQIIDLNAQAIELPYQDDKYSMLILLPSNGNNIKVLARDMQHERFSRVLALLKPNDVALELPKFDLEYSADLVQYLQPLKITEIFNDKANLTGIIDKEMVKISNIVHKTRIEVNEQGTKAAAATAAVVIPLMGSSSQKLIIDRPFIFFIYQKESQNIIFEGIFAEPKGPAQNPNVQADAPNQYFTQQRIASPYRNNNYMTY